MNSRDENSYGAKILQLLISWGPAGVEVLGGVGLEDLAGVEVHHGEGSAVAGAGVHQDEVSHLKRAGSAEILSRGVADIDFIPVTKTCAGEAADLLVTVENHFPVPETGFRVLIVQIFFEVDAGVYEQTVFFNQDVFAVS